jgi:MFS family permease
MAFRHRLQLLRASPRDLRLRYHRAAVYGFALRNLAVLIFGLPLAALGIVIFAVPFLIPRWLTRALDLEEDLRATSKFLATLILAPLWMGLVSGLVWKWLGWKWALLALLLLLPLALFTRYFVERHAEVLRDGKVFFALANRAKLKARLLIEGERLSTQVQSIAGELRARVVLSGREV